MAYYDQSVLVNDILSLDRDKKRKPFQGKLKKGEIEGTYHKWLTAKDNCGYLPIHIAAQFGSVKVFRILWESILPRNMIHLRGYRGNDRIQLVNNSSLKTKTKDGQFSFSLLHNSNLKRIYRYSTQNCIEMFWNSLLQMIIKKS